MPRAGGWQTPPSATAAAAAPAKVRGGGGGGSRLPLSRQSHSVTWFDETWFTCRSCMHKRPVERALTGFHCCLSPSGTLLTASAILTVLT